MDVRVDDVRLGVEVVAPHEVQQLGAREYLAGVPHERLEEREANQTLEVVYRQVDAFSELLKENPGYAVIAYEPVWAIGTGKVATPAQAQEVHAAIRARLAATTSPEVAEKTRILYGGSVKDSNAAELLGCPDIDGALVGGASLDAAGFGKIIAAAAS